MGGGGHHLQHSAGALCVWARFDRGGGVRLGAAWLPPHSRGRSTPGPRPGGSRLLSASRNRDRSLKSVQTGKPSFASGRTDRAMNSASAQAGHGVQRTVALSLG